MSLSKNTKPANSVVSRDSDRPLAERAAAAARAEIRGDRAGILGAIGRSAPWLLVRQRRAPERWSVIAVMERMEEAFRTLARLPVATRPRGYVNSMPFYVYDRGDLNAQIETHELERMTHLRAGMTPPIRNPESVITQRPVTSGNSQHGSLPSAEIDDAATEERDEVSRAPGSFRPLAEGDVAVVGGVRLRPSHQALDLGGIECGGDAAGEGLHVHRYAVAVRQIIGLAVAAVVDRIALEAGRDEPADDLREAQASS